MGVKAYTNPGQRWFHFEPPKDMDMFPARIIAMGRHATTDAIPRLNSDELQAMNPPGFHCLIYILSGEGRLSCREGRRMVEHIVPAGQLFMISHDLEYEYWFPGPCETFWICLSGELADRTFNSIAARQRVFALPPDAPPFIMLQSLLARALSGVLSPFAVLSAGCEFLIQLKEAAQSLRLNARERFLRQAEVFVREQIESVGVPELAKAFGYNGKYFQSYFKGMTGQTPGAFIQSVRLNAAATLLSNTSIKISAVAQEAGFTDGSHLCRLFKTRYGLSPEVWRSRQPKAAFV